MLKLNVRYSWLIICFLIAGCGVQLVSHQSETLGEPIVVHDQDTLVFRLYRTALNADSVSFYLDSVTVQFSRQDDLMALPAGQFNPGISTLKISISRKGRVRSSQENVYKVSDIKPDIIHPENVRFLQHDTSSFTQGLVFYNHHLFESTGLVGKSRLNKIDAKTGGKLESIKLNDSLFGEGLTVIGDSMYQLTWKNRLVLVYDKNMKLHKELVYKYEGWGLTSDGNQLVASDGSECIYYLSPTSLDQERLLTVYDNKGVVQFLNELEYVNGQIWANVLGKDYIIIIDERTGKVLKQINCSHLIDRKQLPFAGPLNGIAYEKSNNLIYLTGKNWPFLIVWEPFFAD